MTNSRIFKTMIMVFATAAFIACSDDGGDDDPAGGNNNGGNGGGTPSTNKYSGSATYGDLVTFELNTDNSTYSIFNETTQQTASGTYAERTDSVFSGIYQVNANQDVFFGIELDDKIFVANFPSGRAENDISFGVSSEIDNSGKINEIVGDYFYVRLGQYIQSNPMEWGVFTMDQDSLWGVVVDAGQNDPGDTLINFPLNYNNNDATSRSFDGEWNVSGDRINVQYEGIDGSNLTVTGYAYAAGNTTAFLMDFGTGLGTAICYKIDPSSTLASISGNYKYIDFDQDGDKGAGNLAINATGGMRLSYTDGTIANTYTVDLLSSLSATNIPNVYYAGNVSAGGDDVYLVAAGDAIMFYVFDNQGNFSSYGAGAKL